MPFRFPLDPPIDFGGIPDGKGPGLGSGLVFRVDHSHGHVDQKRVERSGLHRGRFLPYDFGNAGRTQNGAGLQIHRVGIRSPLLADLQWLLYSDSAWAKLPSTVIYSAPVRIVDHCLRAILAPHADARRDLVVVTVGDHDCDRAPEVPGQIILDVVRPAVADADGPWIDGLRLAIADQKEQDGQTVRNEAS